MRWANCMQIGGLLEMLTGLSVPEFISVVMTPRTKSIVSCEIPWTWGQQRKVYASWTLSQNRWLSKEKDKLLKECADRHRSTTYVQFPKDKFQNAIRTWVDEQQHLVLCGSWYCERLKKGQEKVSNLKVLRRLKNVVHLPLSKAADVPLRTSRVKAATTSACLAIIPARSTASAPIDVINWVPLIKAKPSLAPNVIGVKLWLSRT